MPAVTYADLKTKKSGADSASLREQVQKARGHQLVRFKQTGLFANAGMESKEIRKYCILSVQARALLELGMAEMNLSARAHDRILKVARTIADMDEADTIGEPHISEAIQYRCLDKGI